jgi:hypothetical protein
LRSGKKGGWVCATTCGKLKQIGGGCGCFYVRTSGKIANCVQKGRCIPTFKGCGRISQLCHGRDARGERDPHLRSSRQASVNYARYVASGGRIETAYNCCCQLCIVGRVLQIQQLAGVDGVTRSCCILKYRCISVSKPAKRV